MKTPPVLAMLACLLALIGGAGNAVAAARTTPRVVVVVIDGLDRLQESDTPHLLRLIEAPQASFWADALASMPTVTNTNHSSIGTGVHPQAHAVTGNAYWDAKLGREQGLDRPELLEVETIFSVARRSTPGKRSGGFFGKSKLARLFAAGGIQSGPDVLWFDRGAGGPIPPLGRALSSDDRTVDAFLLEAAELDFAFLNLPDVDRSSHVAGPHRGIARKAIRRADRAIARLVAELQRRGLWQQSVLFVTADHGFARIKALPNEGHLLDLHEAFRRSGVERIGIAVDGRLAHLHALSPDPAVAEADLRKAFEAMAALAGVEEAYLRRPIAGIDAPLLPAIWRAAHPRIGDAVVLSRPGVMVTRLGQSDRADVFRGHHGGVHERRVPLLVTGGWPRLQRAPKLERVPEAPDVGATAAALLGLPIGLDLRGLRVPPELRGIALPVVADGGPPPASVEVVDDRRFFEQSGKAVRPDVDVEHPVAQVTE